MTSWAPYQLDNKLDTKIDQLDNKLDTKIDQLDNKLDTKIDQLDNKLDTKIDGLRDELKDEMRRNTDRIMLALINHSHADASPPRFTIPPEVEAPVADN